jgi:hypothetical protein
MEIVPGACPTGHTCLTGYIKAGNPVVPLLLKLPLKDLPPGSYHVEIGAMDSTGKSASRAADFEIVAATAPAVGWDKN